MSRVFFTGFPIRERTIHLKLSQPHSFRLLAPKGPSSPTVTCHHPTHLPATGSLSCLLFLSPSCRLPKPLPSKSIQSIWVTGNLRRWTGPQCGTNSTWRDWKNVSFRKQCRKYSLLHMVFVKLYNNVTHYMLEAISGPQR